MSRNDSYEIRYSIIFWIILGILVIIFLLWSSDYFSERLDNLDNNFLQENNLLRDSFSNISFNHWRNLPITYAFENEGTERQKNLTRLAFSKIEEETFGVVYFEEVNSDPSISIYFKPADYKSHGGHTVADAQITEMDLSRNLLLKGRLNFYGQGFVCNTGYPALEVHEILHLFDIPHNPLVKSIMSPYTAESSSKCKVTKIDDEYLSCLRYIYSNGEIEGNCDFPNVINEEELESVCKEGWYEVEGTDYCCPEPNMRVENGYCV